MHKRRVLAVAAALALCAGAAHAALNPAVGVAHTACGNEAIRVQQGAPALALPECRAYELVSEPKGTPTVAGDKSTESEPETQAAVGGGAVAFHSWYSPPGAPSDGDVFVSKRGSEGWQTSALDPTQSTEKYGFIDPVTTFVSGEGTAAMLATNPAGSVPEPAVVAGEPTEGEYLLRRVEDPLSYQLMDPTPEDVQGTDAVFQGGSQDFNRVFFNEAAPLLPGAPAGEGLYVWNEGTLRLAAYSPDGVPVQAKMATGVSANLGEIGHVSAMAAGAISRDGERIVFETGGALYLREHVGQSQSAIVPGSLSVNGEQCTEPAKACTVQLDAVQGGPGASGGARFWGASADGSRVFFTDTNELTAGANTTAEKPDLYEYDVESAQLTDLTADVTEPAAVQGIAAGVSEDGSYVYLVVEGVLTEAPNVRGERAVKHKQNLYLSHEGVITFIATVALADSEAWGINRTSGLDFSYRTAEVSPDGRYLAFNSILPLTGYNNAPGQAGECVHEGCDEIFLYDAATGSLHCASCGRPGSRPTGDAMLELALGTEPRHQLMGDGRVFFSTSSPLLVQDENGTSDVYGWAPAGVADCQEGSAGYNSQSAGCLYLVSTGTSPESSAFADASENGGDVFFTTEQALLASDTDNELSLYDARVDGGFSGVVGALVEPPSCEGREACGPPASEAPVEAFGASVTFTGPGDLLPGKATEKVSVVGKGNGVPKLSRQEKLRRALRACAKKPKRKRGLCRRQANRRYGKGKGARR